MPGSSPETPARGLAWMLAFPFGPRVLLAPEDGAGSGGGDDPGTPGEEVDVKAAGSSDAETDKGAEPSFEDAIAASLGADKEDSPDSAKEGQDAKAPEAPAEAKVEDEAKEPRADPTEDELKRYKPETAQRMRDLLDQRNDVRVENDRLKQEIEPLNEIREFCRSNNLSAGEVDQTFQIAGLIKNDPEKAFEAVKAIYEQLAGVVGERLPDDLAEEVRLGYVSEPRARELARLRAGSGISQARQAQEAERAEAQKTAERTAREVGEARDALNEWEKAQSRNDPDWTSKRARLDEQLELRMRREGRRPSTKQEAVSWGDEALKRVNDEFARLRPRPTEVRTLVTDRASGGRTPAPKSLEEAVFSALGA